MPFIVPQGSKRGGLEVHCVLLCSSQPGQSFVLKPVLREGESRRKYYKDCYTKRNTRPALHRPGPVTTVVELAHQRLLPSNVQQSKIGTSGRFEGSLGSQALSRLVSVAPRRGWRRTTAGAQQRHRARGQEPSLAVPAKRWSGRRVSMSQRRGPLTAKYQISMRGLNAVEWSL